MECSSVRDGEEFIFRGGRYLLMMSRLFACVFDASKPRNGRHSHAGYEICFVLSGGGEFINGGVRHKIDKNCIFAGAPWLPHEIVWSGGEALRLRFFSFTVGAAGSDAPDTRFDKTVGAFLGESRPVARGCEFIRAYLDMLGSYSFQADSHCFADVLALMLTDILGRLSRDPRQAGGRETGELTGRLHGYISDNLARKITVKSLAALAHMSERSLHEYFLRNMGSTPLRYVNRMRMTAAAGYLNMGYPVKEIAYLLHYPDVSAFSRVFKKYYQISPGRYAREKHLTG